MNESQPGSWTSSAWACIVVLGFAALVILGFLGLGTWGITWVYTQGPLWAKTVVTIILGLSLWAIISFVRYISDDSMYCDQEKIPY